MEPMVFVEKPSNKRPRSATKRGASGRAKKDVVVPEDVKELTKKDEVSKKIAVGSGKSRREKSVQKNSNLGGGKEAIKGDNFPSKEDFKTPMKRKRGADRDMVHAFLSSTERSSSRLRPRKDVPTFRKVELLENDSERIVGRRVKIYWSGSRRWFLGRVKSYDNEKGCHKIHYDDGEKEDLDLRQERFELEVLRDDGFTLIVEPKSDKKIKTQGGGKDSAEKTKESLKKAVSRKNVQSDSVVGTVKPVKSPLKLKKKRTPRAAKMNRSVLNRKQETKEEAIFTKSIEVDVQHDEVKTDAVQTEINAEESMDVNDLENNKTETPVEKSSDEHVEISAQTTKPNPNAKGDICLDDGKISGEAGDDAEKQTDPEKKMESNDAIARESLSTQDVKDNVLELPLEVDASVHPEEVEKVISSETNMDGLEDVNTKKNGDDLLENSGVTVDLQVNQRKEVNVSAGDMPKDESNADAKILKPQPTEFDPELKQNDHAASSS